MRHLGGHFRRLGSHLGPSCDPPGLGGLFTRSGAISEASGTTFGAPRAVFGGRDTEAEEQANIFQTLRGRT
eukprot:720412-Pyramimonas_sp.AAC.1